MLNPEMLIEFVDQKQPSIAQFDHLTDQVRFSINLRKHFDVDDEDVWKALYERITLKQFKYALALMAQREYFKLNALLSDWGFKQKTNKTKTEDIEPF